MQSFDIRKGVIAVQQSYTLQEKRFESFKAQNVETGHFDVSFDIEGKKLYAHKFILESASEIFNAMFSQLRPTKDEPIIIQDCSYDNFFEFLSFFYSGYCELTAKNIFRLTDMAEFFGVKLLKEFCWKTMAMHITAENVEKMAEAAEVYSLPDMLPNIKTFVSENFAQIVKNERFNNYKKSFVELLSSVTRRGIKEEDFFKAIYEWARHQVTKKTIKGEMIDLNQAEITDPADDIRNELTSILHNIRFTLMEIDFLMEFVIEKGFFLTASEIAQHYVPAALFYLNNEKAFRKVYQMAEKQAVEKQKRFPNEHFNIRDSTKAELLELIRLVKFYEMDNKFLMDFVVGKGLITQEQAKHVRDTYVEIQNGGRRAAGLFKDDDIGLIGAMNKMKVSVFLTGSHMIQQYRYLQFSIPTVPNTVKEMEDIEWYLCLEEDGYLALKHQSVIEKRDYIIVGMKGEDGFKIDLKKTTQLTARYYNI